jgi:hypothetical protein
MDKETKARNLLASAIGSIDTYCLTLYDRHLTLSQRADLMDTIKVIVSESDETEWEHVKHKYLYDDYLVMRTESGKLTDLDMVRVGLTKANFYDEEAYYVHMTRVAQMKREQDIRDGMYGDQPMKQCTGCSEFLPIHKFKKHGGAKCNACRCKAYRANLKAKLEAAAGAEIV